MDVHETAGSLLNSSYRELQNCVDELIGKLGVENTIYLLRSFMDAARIPMDATQRMRILSRYLITECIRFYGLKDRMFFTSNAEEYRESRMICYHLLKKYTDASYSKIAEDFGVSKRNVVYTYKKCDERLSVPYYYPAFITNYQTLEKRTIHFITKLTTTINGRRNEGNTAGTR
ncbi:MAG: hypothetical protein AAGA66_20495 [Bacteroidota bacterium]